MTKLCIINGSPRKGQGTSSHLINELMKLLDKNITENEYYISTFMKDKSVFEEITSYNKIIFVSPLYADCFPSTMLEFMAAFEDFIKEKGTTKLDMYCIVNCGFIEGTQNKTAINIMKHFCDRLNFNWRFGVGIGGGEFMKGSKGMPLNSRMKKPVYNAYLALKEDIENSTSAPAKEDILVNAKIPKFIFKIAGNSGWKSMAKKNGLKPKELYKQIY
ncbi:flavodoxin [Clostridium chromiireducens]|uniref:Flavodoxin n=1 Tax=Clostridium chromiireducens TaxID=225345 RepID=A0A964RLL4_9CLOT|nr:flavodoxin [Clostridium chromiireducens]MVX63815.1 flavodoxin [Clostridium chromiireducens]